VDAPEALLDEGDVSAAAWPLEWDALHPPTRPATPTAATTVVAPLSHGLRRLPRVVIDVGIHEPIQFLQLAPSKRPHKGFSDWTFGYLNTLATPGRPVSFPTANRQMPRPAQPAS
jgi:hypothetical protein